MKHEDEKYTLEINYDKESKEKGLIKIIPKDNQEFVLEADALLDLIAKNLKKDFAFTLSEVDRKEIWMLIIQRMISFKAEKDYKVGDQIITSINMPYPAALYALEKEFGLCQQAEDKKFYAITQDDVLKQLESLKEENKNFVDHWARIQTNGKDLEELKKTEAARLEKIESEKDNT